MTVPIEAYVSVLARDCCLKIKEMGRREAIVCGRHGDYLVVVVRGDVGRAMEKELNERLEKPKEPKEPSE